MAPPSEGILTAASSACLVTEHPLSPHLGGRVDPRDRYRQCDQGGLSARRQLLGASSRGPELGEWAGTSAVPFEQSTDIGRLPDVLEAIVGHAHQPNTQGHRRRPTSVYLPVQLGRGQTLEKPRGPGIDRAGSRSEHRARRAERTEPPRPCARSRYSSDRVRGRSVVPSPRPPRAGQPRAPRRCDGPGHGSDAKSATQPNWIRATEPMTVGRRRVLPPH